MSTATAMLTYVYGVTRAGHTPDASGVDGRQVGRVERDGLAALTSHVASADFGADALRSHLENLEWLEQTARAHHEVVAACAGAGDIVPFRLCTLFADDASVERMLSHEHDRLAATLERLHGCAEWGVKVLTEPAPSPDERTPADVATELPAQDTASPGHAFFARKRAQVAARERASADLGRTVAELEAALRRHARAAVRLRPQDRSLSGHRGEMVLNAAYLVPHAERDGFRAAADSLTTDSIRVELTGPFAPYNFTGEPDA